MKTRSIPPALAVLVFVLLSIAGCNPPPVQAAAIDSNTDTASQNEQIDREFLEQRNSYQAIFEAASVNQTFFRKYDDILVTFSDSMPLKQEITLRIQRTDGRIYGERITWVEAGSVINLGEAYVLPDGDFDVVLMPTLGVYYMDGVRVERRIPIQVQTRK
ncbi:MAG: hypothetical protein WBO46_19235 [Caldilineaceae bacterium]